MSSTEPSPRDKAVAIFRELAGARADQFRSCPEIKRKAEDALRESFDEKTSHDIVFHMTDWSDDAAFMAALLLFPERFTADEVRHGIMDFIIHVPNHVAAAAKLHDFPIQDTFGVGALDGG